MAKQKYYVVWKGRQPGVYSSWNETLAQVHQFPDAVYKSFENKSEAEAAFSQKAAAFVAPRGQGRGGTSSGSKPPVKKISRSAIIQQSVSVDAACSGNPGKMEYRGVFTADGRELFHIGPLEQGTNNIGEFLAIVHALAWLKQQGQPTMPIYSDSRNAQIWVKAGQCRTKLEQTAKNAKIFELIERAERWLAQNKITNPIIKWETEDWGEIPADFGRKG
jgi:ribonuclease HI